MLGGSQRRRVSLILADHNSATCRGLAVALKQSGSLRVVKEVTTEADLLVALSVHHPDLVLLDVRLPGVGFYSSIRRFSQYPAAPAVVLYAEEWNQGEREAAELAGAIGYLIKGKCESLLPRLLSVAASGFFVAGPQDCGRHRDVPHVSTREMIVLKSIRAGKTSKEIAHELDLTADTIRSHTRHLCALLQVRAREELPEAAVRLGLISADTTH